jgi:hypothetical protein
MKRWLLAPGIALLAAPLAAQAPSAPVADALRALNAQFSRNLQLAADDMPVEKYRYKPTSPQMSVADVVGHLATSNEFLCSSASSTPAPAEPAIPKADDVAPAELKARLKRSFDYCTSVLARLDDSRLGDSVPFFGNRKATRAHVMLVLPYDWADHYSQLANYLRLNGISPPNARARAVPVP